MDEPMYPTSLIRSCTRFDCHCYKNGIKRACDTYKLCIKCHQYFDTCKCYILKDLKNLTFHYTSTGSSLLIYDNNIQFNCEFCKYCGEYVKCESELPNKICTCRKYRK